MDILKRERDKMAKEREGMSCLKRGSRNSFKVERGGKKREAILKRKWISSRRENIWDQRERENRKLKGRDRQNWREEKGEKHRSKTGREKEKLTESETEIWETDKEGY